jgi:hypothetical protein
MEPTDLTIEILRGIRDDLGGLREELHQTRAELSERIDGLREELSSRIVASEIRTATAITDLSGTVRDMTAVLRAQHDLRPRLERCERDIADLQQKIAPR